jgi:hypothetical protein
MDGGIKTEQEIWQMFRWMRQGKGAVNEIVMFAAEPFVRFAAWSGKRRGLRGGGLRRSV